MVRPVHFYPFASAANTRQFATTRHFAATTQAPLAKRVFQTNRTFAALPEKVEAPKTPEKWLELKQELAGKLLEHADNPDETLRQQLLGWQSIAAERAKLEHEQMLYKIRPSNIFEHSARYVIDSLYPSLLQDSDIHYELTEASKTRGKEVSVAVSSRNQDPETFPVTFLQSVSTLLATDNFLHGGLRRDGENWSFSLTVPLEERWGGEVLDKLLDPSVALMKELYEKSEYQPLAEELKQRAEGVLRYNNALDARPPDIGLDNEDWHQIGSGLSSLRDKTTEERTSFVKQKRETFEGWARQTEAPDVSKHKISLTDEKAWREYLAAQAKS